MWYHFLSGENGKVPQAFFTKTATLEKHNKQISILEYGVEVRHSYNSKTQPEKLQLPIII